MAFISEKSCRRVAFILSAAVIAVTAGCAGGGGGDSGQAASAAPVTKAAPRGSYAFWPSYPDEPRIQFVRAISSSEDVARQESSALDTIVFGKDSKSTAAVNKPYGVALHDGKVYVCDIREASLVVLDLRKKQTRLVGVSGGTTLANPVCVAVAPDGEIYVGDNERNVIFVFDASERFSRVFGYPKFKPASLAISGDRLYASDTAGQCVAVFNRKSGEKIGTIGSVGDQDGQFRLPLGVAVGAGGDVFVADMMQCRVQRFSGDGKFISAFGQMGDGRGTFARPKHIAVDNEGIVYVVDAAFQNIQMFDAKNRLLMHFGAAGKFAGAMNLPAGVAVSDDSNDLAEGLVHPGFEVKRLIVVSNQFGDNKVSLYALGQVKKGYTAKDLANTAVAISTGAAEPTKERLQFQNAPGTQPTPPGDDEAPAEGAAASGAKADTKGAGGSTPKR